MLCIILACISLTFAASNDIIFKIYASKKRMIGFYLAIIGTIWAISCWILSGYPGIFTFSTETIIWGLISGALIALANLFLVIAMTKVEAGTCSTIYRLNLAPAAILAFFLLNESTSFIKILGLACAIFAVMIFFSSKNTTKHKTTNYLLTLAIFASFFRALTAISWKYGLTQGADQLHVLIINGVIWTITGLLYHLICEKKPHRYSSKILTMGVSSGFLVCGTTYCLMSALKLGDASIVVPISQLSFIVTAILAMIFLGEQLTQRKLAGFILASSCVLLLSFA